ncbi:hypothetical protein [Anaerosporobacter faecicola]|uniref:hypothetical protein n=1 Tax=Anaerosporobacter faecicola TaxID=2718714 RepID=UPI0014397336|nr:hypothetical protein [Anaerosporobacter faecicola]
MIQEVLDFHYERMQNLKKYYPFFKIKDSSLTLYKEGKYADIDMGYVLMAVLRFFIEENNFNNMEVTYGKYAAFLYELLERDFQIPSSSEDTKELIGYIFDKIHNEGKPFYMDYYDPADRKKKVTRVKLINSQLNEGQVTYTLTSDAIEFYLDTKEIKDESKINIEQLLLEKMIRSNDFAAGIQVVRRINHEVTMLRLRKNEVIQVLSNDVFEGMSAYDSFVKTGMRWFDEEQKLFQKNTELIRKAVEKAELSSKDEGATDAYRRSLQEVHDLEKELLKAIGKHNELLTDCIDLQKKADEMLRTAKFNKLRATFDFRDYEGKIRAKQDTSMLKLIVEPLLLPNIRKTWNLSGIEDLITYPQNAEEQAEKVEETETTNYQYEDEEADKRIHRNFVSIARTLFDQLLVKERFDLRAFNRKLEIKYFDDIFRNSDYYSFFVHLCQKREYRLWEIEKEPDTFLEGIIADLLRLPENEKYRNLHFRINLSKDFSEDLIENIQGVSGEEKESFFTSNIEFCNCKTEGEQKGQKGVEHVHG